MIIYVYPKCSTCKNALQFLKKKGISFHEKDITKTPPSRLELERMLLFQKNQLKKLFNTSGLLYKQMQLKEKLPDLSVDEALKLLNQHGMLIKRPFLLSDNGGMVGFNEKQWLNFF